MTDVAQLLKTLDFYPANLGMIPAKTVSHWWQPEWHPVKTAPVHQKGPILHVGMSEPL